MAVASAIGGRVMERLEVLARCSGEPAALTRLPFTPAHRAAAEHVLQWMRESGMRTAIDAAGNVVGRYEAATTGPPALLLGSHLDTVRDAGRYDGALGVVGAIEAVAALNAARERLPFAIEVIAFSDEEGVRFPHALTGSRAVAGILSREALDATDVDGIRLGDALNAFGGSAEGALRIGRARNDVIAYLELHIEQGPVLEAENLPVGIVSALCGASRGLVTVSGEAGHAGTVPMTRRHDALAAAAEMIGEVERLALRDAPLHVATVGHIQALPGVVNVIPGTVRFTLDIRAPHDDGRAMALDRLEAAFQRIAERRGVSVQWAKTYDEAAVACGPHLIAALSAAVRRAGIRPFHLPSGAGHDGLAMATLCPIGMLFVRCAGGISHSPRETVTEADAEVAVGVLLDALRHFELATA
jgi:allantoate deiminase